MAQAASKDPSLVSVMAMEVAMEAGLEAEAVAAMVAVAAAMVLTANTTALWCLLVFWQLLLACMPAFRCFVRCKKSTRINQAQESQTRRGMSTCGASTCLTDTCSVRHLYLLINHRPHDDIAALKRLLREVFTNQIQMDRRISALEPEQEFAPSFNSLVRSRNGWGTLSNAGKAKVELSGELFMGSALLYFQAGLCNICCLLRHVVKERERL